MPIYSYQCKSCGKTFDMLRPINQADAPPPCQYCQSSRVVRSYTNNKNAALVLSEPKEDPPPQTVNSAQQKTFGQIVRACFLSRLGVVAYYGLGALGMGALTWFTTAMGDTTHGSFMIGKFPIGIIFFAGAIGSAGKSLVILFQALHKTFMELRTIRK